MKEKEKGNVANTENFNKLAKQLIEQTKQFIDKLNEKNELTFNNQLIEAIVDALEMLLESAKKGLYDKHIFLQFPSQDLEKLLSYVDEIFQSRLLKCCDEAVKQEVAQTSFLVLKSKLLVISIKKAKDVTLENSPYEDYDRTRKAVDTAGEALFCAENNGLVLSAKKQIAELEARFIYSFTQEAISQQFIRVRTQPEYAGKLFDCVKAVGLRLAYLGEWSLARKFFRTLREKQNGYICIDHELMQTMVDLNAFFLKTKDTPDLVSVSDAERYRKLLKEARSLAPTQLADQKVVGIQQNNFTKANEQLLQAILRDCENLLGPPPRSFAVLALGSTADGLRTSFSDFEYTIVLVGELDISESEVQYIMHFARLLEIKWISIGEPKGFRLETVIDGNVARGGCWGRVNAIVKKIVKRKKEDHGGYCDEITYSLVHARCIYSARAITDDPKNIELLLQNYQEAIQKIETSADSITPQLSLGQCRALSLFKTNSEVLIKFLDRDNYAVIEDIKHQLVQPLLLVLQALAQLYCFKLKSHELWSANPLEFLPQLSMFSPLFATKLQQAFADLMVLRNHLQNYYGEQKEDFYCQNIVKGAAENSSNIMLLSAEWQHRFHEIMSTVLKPMGRWLKQVLSGTNTEKSKLFNIWIQLQMTENHDPAEQEYLIGDVVDHSLEKGINTGAVGSTMVTFLDENNLCQSRSLRNSLEKKVIANNGEFNKITDQSLQKDPRLNSFNMKHFDSRRAVHPVFDGSNELKFYLKARPEKPMLEIAYQMLVRLLFGQESPVTLLTKFEVNNPTLLSPKVYPVLVSRAILGINFATIIENEELLSLFVKNWQQDDREHLFISTLLTNPEDGRPNNFIAEIVKAEGGYLSLAGQCWKYTPNNGQYKFTGRLIPVDNDHIFFPIIANENNPNSNVFRPVIKVKTIIYLLFYYFESMGREPLSTITIERLLAIDPKKFIETWLTQLIKVDQDFKKLFSEKEISQLNPVPETCNNGGRRFRLFNLFQSARSELLNTESNRCELSASVSLNMIWEVYLKLQRLQSFLAAWKKKNHPHLLEVLREIEPRLDKYYDRVSANGSLLQRWHSILGTNTISMTITAKTQNMRTESKALTTTGNSSIKNIETVLRQFQDAIKTKDFVALAKTFIESFVQSDIQKRKEAIDRFLTYPSFHQQQILSAIDFRSFDLERSAMQKIQKEIINAIFNAQQDYTILKLHNWLYLDDTDIAKLLAHTPALIDLDLTGCTALSGVVIDFVAKNCPLLERLCLNRTFIKGLKVKFNDDSALEKLEVKECSLLVSINITALHLETLVADQCSELTELHVTAARNARASLLECAKLKDKDLYICLNLSSCNLEKFSASCIKKLRSIIKGEITQVIFYKEEELKGNMQALTVALRWNQQIKVLKIYECKINDSDLSCLATALMDHAGITTLDLGYNDFKAEGISALGQVLKTNRSLTCLKFWHSYINDNGIKYLCEALRENSTLKTIELNFSQQFKDKESESLLETLSKKKGISISLVGTNFSLVGTNISQHKLCPPNKDTGRTEDLRNLKEESIPDISATNAAILQTAF